MSSADDGFKKLLAAEEKAKSVVANARKGIYKKFNKTKLRINRLLFLFLYHHFFKKMFINNNYDLNCFKKIL